MESGFRHVHTVSLTTGDIHVHQEVLAHLAASGQSVQLDDVRDGWEGRKAPWPRGSHTVHDMPTRCAL